MTLATNSLGHTREGITWAEIKIQMSLVKEATTEYGERLWGTETGHCSWSVSAGAQPKKGAQMSAQLKNGTLMSAHLKESAQMSAQHN